MSTTAQGSQSPRRTRRITISPTQPPPVGLMGGSVHRWVRGLDPFRPAAMPPEFRHRVPQPKVETGWWAEDYWGNPIGFATDGNTLEVSEDADFTPVPRPDPAKEGAL